MNFNPGQLYGVRVNNRKMEETARLLIRNAAQIVRVCSNREESLVGEAMKTVSVLEKDAEGLSVAVGSDGNIISLGTDSEVETELGSTSFERVIDAEGMSVIPGLVDGHSHPVWVGDRVHEFAMKVFCCRTHTYAKGSGSAGCSIALVPWGEHGSNPATPEVGQSVWATEKSRSIKLTPTYLGWTHSGVQINETLLYLRGGSVSRRCEVELLL